MSALNSVEMIISLPLFDMNLEVTLKHVMLLSPSRFCTQFLEYSFYNIKYGSSVITSKNQWKILSNENIKIGVSRKIVVLAF